LKYRNNKWIGLNRKGEPFTVHVKHGSTRKYSRRLIETIAKDLGVSREEFTKWYHKWRVVLSEIFPARPVSNFL